MTDSEKQIDAFSKMAISNDDGYQHRFTVGRVTPVFCEGVSQITVGFPVSRLIFNSHPPSISESGKEVTHFVAAELVISTNGLVHLAKQLVASLVVNKDQILQVGDEWTADLINKISELQKSENTDD